MRARLVRTVAAGALAALLVPGAASADPPEEPLFNLLLRCEVASTGQPYFVSGLASPSTIQFRFESFRSETGSLGGCLPGTYEVVVTRI